MKYIFKYMKIKKYSPKLKGDVVTCRILDIQKGLLKKILLGETVLNKLNRI